MAITIAAMTVSRSVDCTFPLLHLKILTFPRDYLICLFVFPTKHSESRIDVTRELIQQNHLSHHEFSSVLLLKLWPSSVWSNLSVCSLLGHLHSELRLAVYSVRWRYCAVICLKLPAGFLIVCTLVCYYEGTKTQIVESISAIFCKNTWIEILI